MRGSWGIVSGDQRHAWLRCGLAGKRSCAGPGRGLPGIAALVEDQQVSGRKAVIVSHVEQVVDRRCSVRQGKQREDMRSWLTAGRLRPMPGPLFVLGQMGSAHGRAPIAVQADLRRRGIDLVSGLVEAPPIGLPPRCPWAESVAAGEFGRDLLIPEPEGTHPIPQFGLLGPETGLRAGHVHLTAPAAVRRPAQASQLRLTGAANARRCPGMVVLLDLDRVHKGRLPAWHTPDDQAIPSAGSKALPPVQGRYAAQTASRRAICSQSQRRAVVPDHSTEERPASGGGAADGHAAAGKPHLPVAGSDLAMTRQSRLADETAPGGPRPFHRGGCGCPPALAAQR